jgi:hypothetical protein
MGGVQCVMVLFTEGVMEGSRPRGPLNADNSAGPTLRPFSTCGIWQFCRPPLRQRKSALAHERAPRQFPEHSIDRDRGIAESSRRALFIIPSVV